MCKVTLKQCGKDLFENDKLKSYCMYNYLRHTRSNKNKTLVLIFYDR